MENLQHVLPNGTGMNKHVTKCVSMTINGMIKDVKSIDDDSGMSIVMINKVTQSRL